MHRQGTSDKVIQFSSINPTAIMGTTIVGDKTLELLRTRLLDAVRKEAAALVAENFGSASDIDRNFKSLFQAELGPHEISNPGQTTLYDNQGGNYDMIPHTPISCLNPKIADDLTKSFHDNLVGVWKVLEYSLLDKSNRNEKIHPWGPILDGQIIFSQKWLCERPCLNSRTGSIWR